MSSFQYHQFPYGSDNYGVLMHDPASGNTAMVDAGDAAAGLAALAATGWALSHMLITHHHADHTAGLARIKAETGCHVLGPGPGTGGARPIKGVDQTLTDGERFEFAGQSVLVLHTPGHTLDMLNYYLGPPVFPAGPPPGSPDQGSGANPAGGVLFSGDTLFALGCGRLFEGDAPTMWHSLSKLAELPPETQVYCSHEYTEANARFALTIDPDNPALVERVKAIDEKRRAGQPTVPFELGLDLATNPFLRAADPAIRAQLGMAEATDAEVFAEIRSRKDNA